jgi:enoyl-CoA hydratase/carnithine racemase
MTDLVLYEQKDGVVTLTLNNPEQRNAISSRPMIEALVAALARLDEDPDVKVAILTGAGSSFSSGGDIKEMIELAKKRPAALRRHHRDNIQKIPLAFEALEVPIIAAVNGPAIGAGCDLACMCDFRIAADNAKFAESFISLGLIPGDGGAWLLPKLIPYEKACEMALTGDAITAAQALEYGLVSRVVPVAELMDAANALAARMTKNPTEALRMAKRLLKLSRTHTLPQILDLSAAMQAAAELEPEHSEHLDRFVNRTRR